MTIILHPCFSEFDYTIWSFFCQVFEDSVYIKTTAPNFLALLCFKIILFFTDSGRGR